MIGREPCLRAWISLVEGLVDQLLRYAGSQHAWPENVPLLCTDGLTGLRQVRNSDLFQNKSFLQLARNLDSCENAHFVMRQSCSHLMRLHLA